MSDKIPAWVATEALLCPQPWDAGGRVHNWRNHVGDRVRDIWETFTAEQKLAIAADADVQASAEEWE